MSAGEQISRLESLLARIQTRAAQPRPVPGFSVAPVTEPSADLLEASSPPTSPPPTASQPPVASQPPLASQPPFASVSVSPAPLASVSVSPPPDEAAWGEPGEPEPTEMLDRASLPPVDDDEVELEVSEVVEVDIDVDDPVALESGAQPVATSTMPPEELEELEEVEEPHDASPELLAGPEELAEPEALVNETPANEIEEPAPSSSRRPITAEAEQVSYEEGSGPRHTPPPESGKQVATPSAQPPRVSSVPPPPSLEGHTLIGGWREPGLAQGLPGVMSGVRVPAAPSESGPPPASVRPASAPPAAVLEPEITRPASVAAGAVASFTGSAPIAAPATMGELLAMTLGL